MNCVICNTELTGRQKTACSRQCRIKADGLKRKESGRLRKANMTPEAYERMRAVAKKHRQQNPDSYRALRKCLGCGETKAIQKHHAKRSPLCKKCAPRWAGITPSLSKELDKPRLKRIHIPRAIVGGIMTAHTCIQCNKTYWNRTPFKFCTQQCKWNYKSNWIKPEQRLAIYERDNYECQLCNKPVPKGYDYNKLGWSAHGPSLDHIVPRSKGGSHKPNNLQLVHNICNSIKSDTLQPE